MSKDLASISWEIDKYNKELLKDKINKWRIELDDWDIIEWINDIVAESYINLLRKWMKWSLDKSDEKFAKILNQVSDIYWRTEKEKKVIHEMKMPILNNSNVAIM